MTEDLSSFESIMYGELHYSLVTCPEANPLASSTDYFYIHNPE